MVGGAKVIVDLTIKVVLGCLIQIFGGAMAPWPPLSYAYADAINKSHNSMKNSARYQMTDKTCLALFQP